MSHIQHKAMLSISKHEFSQQLGYWARLGQEILDERYKADTAESLVAAEDRIDRWNQTVHEFLLHSFTDDRKATEFKKTLAKNKTGIIQTGPRRSIQLSELKADSLRAKVSHLQAMLAQVQYFLVDEVEVEPGNTVEFSSEIFVVHGHDGEMKQALARFITNLGFVPIVLEEQPDLSQTIIEKFEKHSKSPGYAVVLFSPDDEGRSKKQNQDGSVSELKNRPRQNVILELGFFIGRLGRDRVCVVRRGDMEQPSDFSGVLYTPFDDEGGWKQKLARNMKSVGYQVNANALLEP